MAFVRLYPVTLWPVTVSQAKLQGPPWTGLRLPQGLRLPDGTVMVGDRLHDIEAAKANGLRSIGALWGYGGLLTVSTLPKAS